LIDKYPQIREHLWQKAHSPKTQIIHSSNPPEKDNSNSDSTPYFTSESKESKINKAYFPSPRQRVGHLWQRVTGRYPFFAQQSGSDCGAACLVMVSRYWGKRFSVNRLRDIANVDRNGASLKGLLTAAESLGFATRPVKASLNQLAKQKLPAIVHWEG
ncbi:MAG: cysteine peptidase family C39 domain-containing protein, partial [Dolichospermum sp.]